MRWLKPVLFSVGLVILDEQGGIALLVGIFLVFVYLPRSFGKRFQEHRRERLIRFAIFLSAVLLVFGLCSYNAALATERAAAVIAAVEAYRSKTGAYPERLEQLVPDFIPRIPAKAKRTLMDGGFRYLSVSGRPTLSYVAIPPFGRRVYDFASAKWSRTD